MHPDGTTDRQPSTPSLVRSSPKATPWSFRIGTAVNDSLMFVTTERDEILIFDSNGLRAILRPGLRPIEMTSDRIAYFKERYLEDFKLIAPPGHPDSGLNRMMPFPEKLPGIGGIRADESGNLWVRAGSVYGADELTWYVFATDGRPLARVVTPSRFDPWQVGEEFLLGTGIDEHGNMCLKMYGLTRTP
jgi:hypothetical protein